MSLQEKAKIALQWRQNGTDPRWLRLTFNLTLKTGLSYGSIVYRLEQLAKGGAA